MKATENMQAYHSPLGRMRMLAGTPALDFANTLHWRDGAMADFIPNYRELVAWCVPAQLLSAKEARQLFTLSGACAIEAQDVLAALTALRAAFKKWLTASAANLKGTAKSAAVARRALLTAISDRAGQTRLADLMRPNDDLERPDLRLPLQRCAAAMLLMLLFPAQGDIRQCEADQCGGFFLNQSRSKPRRWCSMDGCGNRAKAERFRLLHQKH